MTERQEQEIILLRKRVAGFERARVLINNHCDALRSDLRDSREELQSIKQFIKKAEEEQTRLRMLLDESNTKRTLYRREIRRLQSALLRVKGQWRWETLERLEQRVKALEESKPSGAETMGAVESLKGQNWKIVREPDWGLTFLLMGDRCGVLATKVQSYRRLMDGLRVLANAASEAAAEIAKRIPV